MVTQKRFYDALAGDYDKMISFDDSLQKRTKVLIEFITGDMNSAADMGSGTGLDSIALSKSGLKVTAFDISGDMLKKAKANAKRYSQQIEFVNTPLHLINSKSYNNFDLIVSLGNTLSNLTPKQLKLSLSKAYNMLNEKGMLIIQVLNYEQVIRNKTAIVNVTTKDNYFYFRFYEFLRSYLRFNILKINKSDPDDFSFIRTKIYPHVFSHYKKILTKAGFKNIKKYGGLDKSKFNKSSKDLIITAVK